MTAALSNTAQGTPNATGVDAFVYPQFIGYAQRKPTTQDIMNPGTRWQDNSVNPPIIYETTGAGVWNTAGGNLATTTTPGEVYLATLAQTESGGAPSSAYVSSANDVATALAAIVVGAGVPATTAQQGYVFLATNPEALAGVLTTNYAINPGTLAYALANGLAIGGSTPGTGAFTTLSASSTLGVTGAATFSSTVATGALTVTGAATISTTLGVTGTATLHAVTQTGTASINASGAATTTIGGSSGAVTLVAGAGGLAVNGGGNSISFGADSAANTISIGNTYGRNSRHGFGGFW